MTTVDLFVLGLHVVTAAIWLGAVFFVAWFLMPAVAETGPDGGKVMAAIQKRGWIVLLPVIASLTVVSGIWLYRPYMGDSGRAAMVLGYGGVIGILALALGGGIVSRSIVKANALAAKAGSLTQAAERAALMASVGQLRRRALTFARIVSVLVIIAAILMVIAKYV